MKRWTYKDVTSGAEKNIREWLDKAGRARSKSVADVYSDCAYGAYSLWADMTAEEQEPEDRERLGKLVGLVD